MSTPSSSSRNTPRRERGKGITTQSLLQLISDEPEDEAASSVFAGPSSSKSFLFTTPASRKKPLARRNDSDSDSTDSDSDSDEGCVSMRAALRRQSQNQTRSLKRVRLDMSQSDLTTPEKLGHGSGTGLNLSALVRDQTTIATVSITTMSEERIGNSTSGETAQAGASTSSASSSSASESEVDEAEPNPVIKTLVAFTDANMTSYQRLTNYLYCGTNLDIEITAVPSEAAQYKRQNAFWNVLYPGCYSSQAEHRGNRYGLFEINPFTIRPFEIIHSRHSMFLWVLKGRVVLKTNAVEIQEINGVRAPVLRSFTFDKHELMIIPGDIPYSLENRTEDVVRIGYAIAPEKLQGP